MFGFGYVKAPPTTHVVHYVNGQPRRRGPGLSFAYWKLNSEVVRVPLTSVDVPYAFNEITADFQDVTVQGVLTYRIADPDRIAELLDFSVDHAGRYRSEDPTKIHEHLVRPAQALAKTFTQQRPLQDLMLAAAALAAHVQQGLKAAESVRAMGLDVISFAVFSLRPTPEMSKAMQADSREKTLQRADEAIYSRRNAAVELERQIRENELNTEIAVAQKQRTVRETQMAADIAVEQQRTNLVDQRVANDRKEAESHAFAVKAVVEAIKDADWRTLMAAGGVNAQTHIAVAFRELAERAERIGNLNITPDLLSSLLETGEPTAASTTYAAQKPQHRGGQKGNPV